jgi:hypothetical protein
MFNKSETKWVVYEHLRNKNQIDIGKRFNKKGYPTMLSESINYQSDEVEFPLLSKIIYYII